MKHFKSELHSDRCLLAIIKICRFIQHLIPHVFARLNFPSWAIGTHTLTHVFTPIGNVIVNLSTNMLFSNGRKLENLEESHTDTERTCETSCR